MLADVFIKDDTALHEQKEKKSSFELGRKKMHWGYINTINEPFLYICVLLYI